MHRNWIEGYTNKETKIERDMVRDRQRKGHIKRVIERHRDI